MPKGKPRRRRKLQTKRWDLDLNDQGSWRSLGHGQTPPSVPDSVRLAFGVPAYSPDDQLQEPSAQRTRMVKDVLRVGKFHVGGSNSKAPALKEFTAGFFGSLVQNFHLAKSRGVAVNLCNTHGDAKTGLVHPSDLIAPIDDVYFDGTTLWASAYVNTSQAEQLRNNASKVSPRILEDWMDGLGNRYQLALGHVAVTDHPVVPGQGPFLDLANTGATTMDFEALFPLVNELLPENVILPDDTTAENLVERLSIIIATLNQAAGEATEAAAAEEEAAATGEALTEAGTEAVAAAGASPEVMEMMNKMMGKMTNLSNQVNSLTGEQTRNKQAAFTDRLNQLGQDGHINGMQASQLKAQGAKYGWDLSLLEPFSQSQSTDLSNSSRRFANGSPPAGNNGRRTDAQVKADLEEQGKPVPAFHPA